MHVARSSSRDVIRQQILKAHPAILHNPRPYSKVISLEWTESQVKSNPGLAFALLHDLYIPFAGFLANHFLIPCLIVGHTGQGVFQVGRQAKMSPMHSMPEQSQP